MTKDKSSVDTAMSETLPTNSLDDRNTSISQSFWFFVCFVGYMDMYSDVESVASYLQDHQGWFCRCAKPMKVEPLHESGYILNIGSFSSFNYEVKPKIAVVLDPPQDNLYVMRTVPVPNYEPPGYEVQYKSLMELETVSFDNSDRYWQKKLGKFEQNPPKSFTRVSWQLDLGVNVEFPKFFAKLPPNLIQATGDRFLAQIVRQISPRLSYKVQQDFHGTRNLPLPDKNSRGLSKIAKEPDFPDLKSQNSDRAA